MRKREIAEFRLDKNLPKFDDAPIREVLKEAMPVLQRTTVGRMRLIRALEFKFGDNYKTFEIPSKVLSHFDGEVEHLRSYIKIKRKHSND